MTSIFFKNMCGEPSHFFWKKQKNFESNMRKIVTRSLKHSAFLLSPLLPSAAIADVVILNALDGNTEAEVQQALNLHPSGTTFLLTGAFNFSSPVFIEKSNITIMGDVRRLRLSFLPKVAQYGPMRSMASRSRESISNYLLQQVTDLSLPHLETAMWRSSNIVSTELCSKIIGCKEAVSFSCRTPIS